MPSATRKPWPNWKPSCRPATRAGPPDRSLELISTPTLLDKPVHRAKRIVALGLLGGLVLGCGAALILDRRSGLVFSEDELRTTLPGLLLERLSLQQTKGWGMACELLAQGPLQQAKHIALIPVGDPDSRGLQALKNTLQSALSGQTLLVSSDLVKTKDAIPKSWRLMKRSRQRLANSNRAWSAGHRIDGCSSKPRRHESVMATGQPRVFQSCGGQIVHAAELTPVEAESPIERVGSSTSPIGGL